MKTKNKAQTALEFLLLLAGVIIISVIAISALGLQTSFTKESTGKKSTEFLDVITKGTEPGGQFKPIECAITANPTKYPNSVSVADGTYESSDSQTIAFTVSNSSSTTKVTWTKSIVTGDFLDPITGNPTSTPPTTKEVKFKTTPPTSGTIFGTITAKFVEAEKNYSCSKSITLKIPTPVSLTRCDLYPLNQTLISGTRQQFLATGYFSDNTERAISTESETTWTVNPTIGQMDPLKKNSFIANNLTEEKSGQIKIAYNGQICNSTTVTVRPALLLTGCTITPNTQELQSGSVTTFNATLTYSNGTPSIVSITPYTTWTASSGLGIFSPQPKINEFKAATVTTDTQGQVSATYQTTTNCTASQVTVKAAVSLSQCELTWTEKTSPTDALTIGPNQTKEISLNLIYSNEQKSSVIDPTKLTITETPLGDFLKEPNRILFTSITPTTFPLEGIIKATYTDGTPVNCQANVKIVEAAQQITSTAQCYWPNCTAFNADGITNVCVPPLGAHFKLNPQGETTQGTCFKGKMYYEKVPPLSGTAMYCKDGKAQRYWMCRIDGEREARLCDGSLNGPDDPDCPKTNFAESIVPKKETEPISFSEKNKLITLDSKKQTLSFLPYEGASPTETKIIPKDSEPVIRQGVCGSTSFGHQLLGWNNTCWPAGSTIPTDISKKVDCSETKLKTFVEYKTCSDADLKTFTDTQRDLDEVDEDTFPSRNLAISRCDWCLTKNPGAFLVYFDAAINTIAPGYNRIGISTSATYNVSNTSTRFVQVQWSYGNRSFNDLFSSFGDVHDLDAGQNGVEKQGAFTSSDIVMLTSKGLTSTALNKKGIYSSHDNSGSFVPIALLHKGQSRCMNIITEEEFNDCVIENEEYIYRIRGLNENLIPNTQWHSYKFNTNYGSSTGVSSPFTEYFRKLPSDKQNCSEGVDWRWANPDVQPVIIDDYLSVNNTSSTTTTLAENLTDSATNVTLQNAGSFDNSGAIIIDKEIITYSGKTGNILSGAKRGVNSTAIAHLSGESVAKYYATGMNFGLVNRVRWRFRENQIVDPENPNLPADQKTKLLAGQKLCSWYNQTCSYSGNVDASKINEPWDWSASAKKNNLLQNCGCTDYSKPYYFRVQYSVNGITWQDIPGQRTNGMPTAETELPLSSNFPTETEQVNAGIQRFGAKSSNEHADYLFRTRTMEWGLELRPRQDSMPHNVPKEDLYYKPNILFDYMAKDKEPQLTYYYDNEKMLSKKFYALHLGDKECGINLQNNPIFFKTFKGCLREGNYIYRVRAESFDYYPYSDWGYSDYVDVNYDFLDFNPLSKDPINSYYLQNTAYNSVINTAKTYDGAITFFPDKDSGVYNENTNKLIELYQGIRKKYPNGLPESVCTQTLPTWASVTIDVVVIVTTIIVAPEVSSAYLSAMLSTAASYAASDLTARVAEPLCGSNCAYIISQTAGLAAGAYIGTLSAAAQTGTAFNKDLFVKNFTTQVNRAIITGTLNYTIKNTICESYADGTKEKRICDTVTQFGISLLMSYTGQQGTINPPLTNKLLEAARTTARVQTSDYLCDKIGFDKGLKSAACTQLTEIGLEQLEKRMIDVFRKDGKQEIIAPAEEPLPEETLIPAPIPQPALPDDVMAILVTKADGTKVILLLRSHSQVETNKILTAIKNGELEGVWSDGGITTGEAQVFDMKTLENKIANGETGMLKINPNDAYNVSYLTDSVNLNPDYARTITQNGTTTTIRSESGGSIPINGQSTTVIVSAIDGRQALTGFNQHYLEKTFLINGVYQGDIWALARMPSNPWKTIINAETARVADGMTLDQYWSKLPKERRTPENRKILEYSVFSTITTPKPTSADRLALAGISLIETNRITHLDAQGNIVKGTFKGIKPTTTNNSEVTIIQTRLANPTTWRDTGTYK